MCFNQLIYDTDRGPSCDKDEVSVSMVSLKLKEKTYEWMTSSVEIPLWLDQICQLPEYVGDKATNWTK